jgi:hypothetical protein
MKTTRWARAALLSALTALGLMALPQPSYASTTSMPDTTLTRYESSADPWVAFQQGVADGRADLSGAAILDFGRPAQSAAGAMGSMDFGGHLDSLSQELQAAERYADGYRLNAAPGASLDVLLGANNSCGTGQPCGSSTCGCANEPSSYLIWGQSWAETVNQLQSYLASTGASYPVQVGAGGADDAEPGFDPSFTNTYDTLSGYSEASDRPMLDFGSLDGGPGSSFWSTSQLYQVAYGFRPDAPFPEIYYPGMAGQWAALSHWSALHSGHAMTIYGVLTEYPTGYSPSTGYSSMVWALNHDYADTHQQQIQWSSNVGQTPVLGAPAGLQRLSGPDRDATAAAVSAASYPAAGSARAAVLARSDSYADAVVGGPLATARGGPLLLSSPNGLDPTTSSELTRVLPRGSTVYLLGGVTALSPAVAAQVAALGYVVQRIAGSDRYATAVAVAKLLGNPSRVFVATGWDFPDALVAGAAAAGTGGAVLLSVGPTPAPETSLYLLSQPGDTVYAVGGPAGLAYPTAQEISGSDRYATAAAVAREFYPAAAGVGLAAGTTFPDSLVAAPLLARRHWPLLLSQPASLPGPVAGFLSGGRVRSLTALGGSGALSDAAAYQARYVASH